MSGSARLQANKLTKNVIFHKDINISSCDNILYINTSSHFMFRKSHKKSGKIRSSNKNNFIFSLFNASVNSSKVEYGTHKVLTVI